MGSLTMRIPTAAAAAVAAETCRNDRRDRNAGFSLVDMAEPPIGRSAALTGCTQTTTIFALCAPELHSLLWLTRISPQPRLSGSGKLQRIKRERNGLSRSREEPKSLSSSNCERPSHGPGKFQRFWTLAWKAQEAFSL